MYGLTKLIILGVTANVYRIHSNNFWLPIRLTISHESVMQIWHDNQNIMKPLVFSGGT